MPSKRDPGKQGRQARNQARRQAGSVRRENAAAPSTAVAQGSGDTSASAGSETASKASTSTRTPRAGFTGGNRPVGWRAALAAVLMATVAFGLLIFNQVTVDADNKAIPVTELSPGYQFAQFALGSGLEQAGGEELPDSVAAAAEEMQTPPSEEKANSFVAYWPVSLLFPVPIIIAGLALWMIHTGRATGRNLMFCLFGMFFASMLTGVFFLPALVALGVANFQVRRAEATQVAQARADAGDGPDATGDVIDVDEADQVDAQVDDESAHRQR